MTMPSTAPSESLSRAWHQEPMLWLVIGIPALTFLAALSTAYIAYQGSDPVVGQQRRSDDVTIHHDPARDVAAARWGVSASASLNQQQLTVHLNAGGAPAPTSLVAIISSTERAQADQLITLSRIGPNTFSGPTRALLSGHWRIELTPTNRAWRLVGDNTALDEKILRPQGLP